MCRIYYMYTLLKLVVDSVYGQSLMGTNITVILEAGYTPEYAHEFVPTNTIFMCDFFQSPNNFNSTLYFRDTSCTHIFYMLYFCQYISSIILFSILGLS